MIWAQSRDNDSTGECHQCCKGAAPPQRLQSGGREIPPMAELLGKRLKTSQSFVKVSEKQPYDMMDTNGYWPWSDPAKKEGEKNCRMNMLT